MRNGVVGPIILTSVVVLMKKTVQEIRKSGRNSQPVLGSGGYRTLEAERR